MALIRLLSLTLFLTFLIGKDSKPLLDVNYQDLTNTEITKKWKQNFVINSYESESYGKFEVGTKLIINKALEGNYKFETQTGLFKSQPSQVAVYSTIIKGGIFSTDNLEASITKEEVTVTKIWAYRLALKKTARFYIGIETENDSGQGKMFRMRRVTDLEKGLNIGELKSLNAPMTKEEALAKLKESKDLLDLEIISQEEYDKLKVELTPIIRGK